MKPDMLAYNGKIYTLNDEGTVCEWMAIHNGRVIALGNGDYLQYFPESAEEILDLEGHTVLPGFIDSHTHLVQTGLDMMAIDLSDCKSIEDIQDRIQFYVQRHNGGSIIYGHGLDETHLKERRLPDRRDLDCCSSDIPIWLNRVEYHTAIVNSRALHMSSIPFNLKGIERDANRLPTGRFTSEASAWIRNFMLSRITAEERMEGVSRAVDSFLSVGVTTVACMEGGYLFHDLDAEFIHLHRNSFPVDISLYYQTLDVQKVVKMGLDRIGGCIFIDGSFGSRTAAIFGNYADATDSNGTLYFDQLTLNEFFIRATASNLQIAVHAIAGRAIEQVLTAYEAAWEANGPFKIRNRIEHFELPEPDHIRRAAKLGLLISVQPAYEYYWGGEGGMYEKRLGRKVSDRTNPYRTMIDSGLILAGGSDCDVTPCNPILGIHAAVNHPKPQHRVTVHEAVAMFTVNGAIGLGLQKSKGHLATDMDGDFIILSEDPFNVDERRLHEIQVLSTFKDGVPVFRRAGDNLG